MASIFKNVIEKKKVIQKLKEIFTKQNFFIKYDDPRLEILNENYNSDILDVEITKSKNDFYFLIIYWNDKTNDKENKYTFRLFENNVNEKWNHILTCDLNEFNKKEFKEEDGE